MNHIQNLPYIKDMVQKDGLYFEMPKEGDEAQPKELSKSQLKKLNKKNWLDQEKAGGQDKRAKDVDPEEIERRKAAKAAEKAAKA